MVGKAAPRGSPESRLYVGRRVRFADAFGGYVVFFHLGSYGQKRYASPKKLPLGYCVVQKKGQSLEDSNSIDIASSDEHDHVSDPPAKRGDLATMTEY